MRVLYEHDINDIEKDYARKYGVDISKVHFNMNDLILRVDMSETERPVEGMNRVTPDIYSPEPEMAAAQKETDEETEAENPVLTQEDIYQKLTDGMIKQMIDSGKGVAEICKDCNLIDSKYAQRLYKRVDRIRSECASK